MEETSAVLVGPDRSPVKAEEIFKPVEKEIIENKAANE